MVDDFAVVTLKGAVLELSCNRCVFSASVIFPRLVRHLLALSKQCVAAQGASCKILVTEGAGQVSSAVIHIRGLLPPVCFWCGPSLRCSAAILVGEKTRLPEGATAPSFAAGRLIEERE
jgi:hypothetical protein